MSIGALSTLIKPSQAALYPALAGVVIGTHGHRTKTDSFSKSDGTNEPGTTSSQNQAAGTVLDQLEISEQETVIDELLERLEKSIDTKNYKKARAIYSFLAFEAADKKETMQATHVLVASMPEGERPLGLYIEGRKELLKQPEEASSILSMTLNSFTDSFLAEAKEDPLSDRSEFMRAIFYRLNIDEEKKATAYLKELDDRLTFTQEQDDAYQSSPLYALMHDAPNISLTKKDQIQKASKLLNEYAEVLNADKIKAANPFQNARKKAFENITGLLLEACNNEDLKPIVQEEISTIEKAQNSYVSFVEHVYPTYKYFEQIDIKELAATCDSSLDFLYSAEDFHNNMQEFISNHSEEIPYFKHVYERVTEKGYEHIIDNDQNSIAYYHSKRKEIGYNMKSATNWSRASLKKQMITVIAHEAAHMLDEQLRRTNYSIFGMNASKIAVDMKGEFLAFLTEDAVLHQLENKETLVHFEFEDLATRKKLQSVIRRYKDNYIDPHTYSPEEAEEMLLEVQTICLEDFEETKAKTRDFLVRYNLLDLSDSQFQTL